MSDFCRSSHIYSILYLLYSLIEQSLIKTLKVMLSTFITQAWLSQFKSLIWRRILKALWAHIWLRTEAQVNFNFIVKPQTFKVTVLQISGKKLICREERNYECIVIYEQVQRIINTFKILNIFYFIVKHFKIQSFCCFGNH